jgi:hypothetical protein
MGRESVVIRVCGREMLLEIHKREERACMRQTLTVEKEDTSAYGSWRQSRWRNIIGFSLPL